MQNKQKHQRDDMQREEEPECLGPKCNRVLGGGKHASERVNRRCDERLLEAGRLDVVTPGLAASEERHGAGRVRHDDMCKAPDAAAVSREKVCSCVAPVRFFVGEPSNEIRYLPLYRRPPGFARDNQLCGHET